MLPAPGTRARGQCLLAILAGLALAGAGLVAPALAAEPLPAEFSAKFVPADAAFYHVCMNNREQLDIFLKSRAFAALKEMPAVKEILNKAEEAAKEKGQNLEDLKKWGQQPPVKNVIELFKDALGQEVFIYGGPNWADCAEFLIRFSNANRFGGISASAKGQEGAQVMARMMLRILQQHLGLLKVPDTVVGFKIKDTKRANDLIDALEAIIKPVAMIQDKIDLKGRIKRTPVGDASFLTINLDGNMVPWDQVPIGEIEEKKGEFKPLVQKLKTLKYTISLGVRDGWLLVTSQ